MVIVPTLIRILCVNAPVKLSVSLFERQQCVCLEQGSPTPGPLTGTGPQPVRSRAAQQEVSSGRASEASSVFTAAPHCSHYRLSSASCQHYGELYNYFIIYYNVIIIKCTINVMHLSHPKSSPPPRSVEKLSSTKPVPGARKVGGRWFRARALEPCCLDSRPSSTAY